MILLDLGLGISCSKHTFFMQNSERRIASSNA